MYLNYGKDSPDVFLQNDTKVASLSCFVQESESFSQGS